MANVELKLQALNALLQKLPVPRREHWARIMRAVSRRARKVAGDAQPVEWDLALANELDRIYRAVSDEASRVRREGTDALAETSSALGYGLWPLALAALAVGYAVSMSKR